MARFPKSEPEILALANNIASGLTANLPIYPAPPIDPAALTALISSYTDVQSTLVNAQAVAKQATIDKDEALAALTDAMRTDLRYAENATNMDNAKLSLLGWGGKAAASALAPPGQPRMLEGPQQGDDWIFLDWKAPIDGGAVAAYKVQRRERPAAKRGLAFFSAIPLAHPCPTRSWRKKLPVPALRPRHGDRIRDHPLGAGARQVVGIPRPRRQQIRRIPR